MKQRHISLPVLPVLAALSAAVLLAACSGMPGMSSGPSAQAQLMATTGSTTSGQVKFTQVGDKVLISGEVHGLKPNTEHGFHVHEKGDCSSGDGMSAGGHFNPGGMPHGQHNHGAHHTGDLPSLRAAGTGVAKFSFESKTIAIGSGSNDIVGKGLIVHRDPDDYQTQPTGNAGPRLACAVITRL